MRELKEILEAVREMGIRAKTLAQRAGEKTATQASYLAIDMCCKAIIGKIEAALKSIENSNSMERPRESPVGNSNPNAI